ncbi:hypothetical protein, partial [Novacetimonas hansenii]|uniref:hypothetical protein n=1 Tax=Novacetimonas hansenii TaxID=436 RepID=UPI001C650DB8
SSPSRGPPEGDSRIKLLTSPDPPDTASDFFNRIASDRTSTRRPPNAGANIEFNIATSDLVEMTDFLFIQITSVTLFCIS